MYVLCTLYVSMSTCIISYHIISSMSTRYMHVSQVGAHPNANHPHTTTNFQNNTPPPNGNLRCWVWNASEYHLWRPIMLLHLLCCCVVNLCVSAASCFPKLPLSHPPNKNYYCCMYTPPEVCSIARTAPSLPLPQPSTKNYYSCSYLQQQFTPGSKYTQVPWNVQVLQQKC